MSLMRSSRGGLLVIESNFPDVCLTRSSRGGLLDVQKTLSEPVRGRGNFGRSREKRHTYPRETPNTPQTHRRPASMSMIGKAVFGCDAPERDGELEASHPTVVQALPASSKSLSPRRVAQLPTSSPVLCHRGLPPSLPPSRKCLGTAIADPAASTAKKGHWFAYLYEPPTTQQAGTVVSIVSPTGQNISPGKTPDSARSAVDVLAAPPAATPHDAPLTTELAPPAGRMELLPAELSVAIPPQGSISCAFLTSAGTSPILDSSNSGLSNEGLETTEKSKQVSENEKLAELHYASETSAGTSSSWDSSDSSLGNEGLEASEQSKPLSENEELAELHYSSETSAGTSSSDSSDSSLGNEGLETSDQSKPLSENEELAELYYAAVTSAGASPISDSSDSSLSNEGVETSEEPKPLSEKAELAVLQEKLAELNASIAKQTGDEHCETLFNSLAVSLLERGLFAIERVWVSE